MSNYQSGTFNTLAQNSQSIGGGLTVWARVREVYQGGGYLDTSKYKAGDVIPAGTPVIFNGPGAEVTVVDITDAANLAQVNGLTFNDVCIPDGVIEATVAVVRNGRIYANRANGGNGLPKSLVALLPGVEFVYEGDAPAEPGA